MAGLLIGYARVSTHDQDLTAQKNALAALGVSPDKTFTDQGLTGTNRARPGLRKALAACRDGDTLEEKFRLPFSSSMWFSIWAVFA